jgi:cytochrome o ubiquinol oxidase operon protein cyoD
MQDADSPYDRTPGVEDQESTANSLSYTVGFGFAVLLTFASFVVAQTNLLWPPGVAIGLVVLAFAQIGVHLIFFLHIGTGREHENNLVSLVFGLWIVFLVIAGSVFIIANLNANMMPMP